MRSIVVLFLFFQLFLTNAQEIETTYIGKLTLKADKFIGVDTFENYYYIIGTTLYKKTPNKTYAYTNAALGTVHKVDISNPLKIIVFYRNFNTIVILDNRLNELTDSINFSTETFGKNVATLSVSSNNNLWLYSLDDNVLSLWNYETKKTILNTQPLTFYSEKFEGISQTSTYNYCWLISTNTILKFSEFGSFVSTQNIEALKNITPYGTGFFYSKDSKIYYSNTKKQKEVFITKSRHRLNDFTLVKNNLYFFDGNVLYYYSVLKK